MMHLSKKRSFWLWGSLSAVLLVVCLTLYFQASKQHWGNWLKTALATNHSSLAREHEVFETAEYESPLLEDKDPFSKNLTSYDLASHQLLSRVILLLRENYVEPERIKPQEMFLAGLDYIQKTIPEIMIDTTQAPTKITVSVGNSKQAFELGAIEQLWEVTMALRDIFRFLQSRINDPEQLRDIEYAAVNGMLSTLDPHSVLLKPESFDEVKLSTKGEFGGLGIVISIKEGALTIISPIAGTPAAKAGLKAKDKIVKIGEESSINMGLEEAVNRLRGKPGSKVNVWVLRQNWSEPKRFELARAIIKIESVTSELLKGGIGYVRIKNFQNNTFDDLKMHLEKLHAKNGAQLKGLILDLRNNPGGLLDQAIAVSDHFIDRGDLVITVGEGNKKREVKTAKAAGTELGYSMAVLVNGGSASASEIVAGAIKNHDRGFVLGQQTFGKGSVQVLYDFKDKSALKLTVAQYLTPGDISIQSVGIIPDVEVVPTTVEKELVHLLPDDESLREKDLDKHLERRGNNGGNAPPTLAPAIVPDNGLALPAPTGEAAAFTAFRRIAHLLPKEAAANSAALNPEGEGQKLDKVPKKSELSGNPALKRAEEAALELSDEFKSDFEIELARDVLLQGESQLGNRQDRSSFSKRGEILKAATGLLQERAHLQDQEIITRFAEFGVDWSSNSSSTKGRTLSGNAKATSTDPKTPSEQLLKASDVEVKFAPAAEVVKGGETLILKAAVRNLTSKPLYRVYGVSNSDNLLLKNREFVFGKINPQEVKSWTIEVKLPKDMVERADKVTLALADMRGNAQNVEASTIVQIQELPKPRFAYRYYIDDRQYGNGDGLLEPGEKVDLQVQVTNLGPGPAEEVVVTVKNLAGKLINLDYGRDKLGGLAVGATKTANLRFAVGKQVGTNEQLLALKVGIWDNVLGSSLSEIIKVPLYPKPPKLIADKRIVKLNGAKAVPVYLGADIQMPLLARLNPGVFIATNAALSIAGGTSGATSGGALPALAKWRRLELKNGWLGFIQDQDLLEVSQSPKVTTALNNFHQALNQLYNHGELSATLADLVVPISWQAAPEILLDNVHLKTRAATLKMPIVLKDERKLKDIFIFVNDKKVYYQDLRDLPLDAHGVSSHILVDLPLGVGANAIVIIVREDAELAARKIFSIYREANTTGEGALGLGKEVKKALGLNPRTH